MATLKNIIKRKNVAPKLLDALLDIKLLAESSDDNGYDPYALLDLIAQEARAAVAEATGGTHE